MARELTKKLLQDNYNITKIDEDGKVYVGGKLRKPVRLIRKTKYKEYHEYLGIHMHDFTNGTNTIYPLARVILAWKYGKIGSDMDADHIDGNKLNNKIDNLRIVTHMDNMHTRAKNWKEIADEWCEIKRTLKEKGLI